MKLTKSVLKRIIREELEKDDFYGPKPTQKDVDQAVGDLVSSIAMVNDIQDVNTIRQIAHAALDSWTGPLQDVY